MNRRETPWAVEAAMVLGSLQKSFWTERWDHARFYLRWVEGLMDELAASKAEAVDEAEVLQR